MSNNKELLLKYTLLPEPAKTIRSQDEWDRYAGSLAMRGNDVWGIAFQNKDTVNNRDIMVMNTTLSVNNVYEILPPTPGGCVDVRNVTLQFPNGNAILQIVTYRIVNLRYVEIPIEKI